MNHPVRRLWGLAVVVVAVAVAVLTRDAGFTFLTLAGGLLLPRILGFGGHHRGRGLACAGGHGHRRGDARLQEWHRQAHGEVAAPPAAGAV